MDTCASRGFHPASIGSCGDYTDLDIGLGAVLSPEALSGLRQVLQVALHLAFGELAVTVGDGGEPVRHDLDIESFVERFEDESRDAHNAGGVWTHREMELLDARIRRVGRLLESEAPVSSGTNTADEVMTLKVGLHAGNLRAAIIGMCSPEFEPR